MNTNDLLLRALTNLFGQDTLIYLIFTFFFLVIQKRIKLFFIKKGISEHWSTFLAAWLTFIFLLASSLLFKNLATLFREKRFGADQGMSVEIGLGQFIAMTLISSIIIALGFCVYQSLRAHFIGTIKNIKKQILLDGLSIFILANLTLLSSSTLVIVYECLFINTLAFESLIILPSILTSLAIWLSPIIATTLAMVTYNYIQYTLNLKDQQKELKIIRLQQQLTRSQLDALSSKINPHFLYNALNSIAGLANTDGIKTRNMAIALAKLFRHNLNKEESNYITVKDELEMVSTYLVIEKIRFEDRLQYTIEVLPDIENELIPRHLLQPLVENAVKHGGKPNGIHIHIFIRKEQNCIEISVGDDGKPFDTNFNPGYGLKSVYDKLDLLTAGNYEIAFLTTPKAVQIRFKNNFDV